jgi:hypothetical protein
MKLKTWAPLNFKKDYKTIEMGDGINTFHPPLNILDSQNTDMRNIISSKYPAATVRNGKTKISTVTTPNALGQRNNQYIHVVDGTTWKYWTGTAWTNVQTGLTNATGEFAEFTTGTTKYTIFSNGTDRYAWDGTTVTSLTNAPLTKIFTCHKGRIYWAKDNVITYSALNLINDYTKVDDAGTIVLTKSQGSITSIFTYNNKVNIWTGFSMHEIYGTGPDTYELVDIEGEVGCISDRSVIVANKRLYTQWYDGVYEYSGAGLLKISEPYFENGNNVNGVTGGITSFVKSINFTYKDKIVSGSYGDFLYISIPYGTSATTNNLTLIFETKLRKWYIRQEGFINFVTIANILYAIDTSGNIWDLTTTATTDDGTAISWYMISKAFNEGTPSAQTTISEMWVIFDLPTGSTMEVQYSSTIDGNDFVDLYDFTTSSDEQNQRVILPVTALQNVNWYRLKFSGTGQSTIYMLEKKVLVNYNE